MNKNSAWHKRHSQKLKKAKGVRTDRLGKRGNKPTWMTRTESLGQPTMEQLLERAREIKAAGGETSWLKYMWIRFISVRGIVYIRKVAYYLKQYAP